MTVYVRRDGSWVDRASGEPMLVAGKEYPVGAPAVMRDIPEYRSPVDGRVIGSRSERREDLKRNNCVEWDEGMSPTKGKIRNQAFARKRGLTVSEDFL
jgi:hypothetical protein